MMETAYELTEKIFQNAQEFNCKTHYISNAPAVDALILETSRWFSILQGEEDENARTIKFFIWNIRISVMFALLPFNHDELGLMNQLKHIETLSRYFPLLKERMERLSEIVHFLIEKPTNLKREAVFQLLHEAKRGGRGVGLVAALTNGTTPGWSGRLVSEILSIAPRCELIMTRKSLVKKSYRQIILPSSGRNCPFFYELLYGCRAASLDIVAYKREGARTPEKRILPRGTSTKRVVQITPIVSPELLQPQDLQIDEWESRRFWESIRGSAIRETSGAGIGIDRQFLVKARLVLLADNTMVYLQDDKKMIELSDLMDNHMNMELSDSHFPRKQVDQLGRGDIIVLRTSGSGDYLIDVANSLMEADGKGQLRSIALDWKPVLLKALQEYGSEVIANLLKEKGHLLSNHNYIWMWSTLQVIRPQSKALFRDLISTLRELNYKLEGNSPEEIGDIKWEQMREIIHYHAMAGKKIRQLLLTQLRRIIEERIAITDCYHLTLPEVSAGELSICRVSRVDTETQEIPYYKIGTIIRLGE